jgi:hypothetical protein
MADEIIIETRAPEVIEVGVPGPVGPAGTGLETLTAPGDTLYRGQTTGERLPIGSAGQILRVNSGGTAPEWGAAPASGVSSVNGRTGAVQVSDFGADPQIVVGATTINGSFSLSFQAPHTAYEVPRPTRLSANQRGITRLFVDRPFADADITLTLPTGGGVQNGDIVEVYNLITLSGRKAIINTQGFGTFELYSRQSAFFVYSANTGPARWLRSYDNQFLSTVPDSPSSTSGEIGDMAFDSRFFYVKVPVVVGGGITGSWRRVAWAFWAS